MHVLCILPHKDLARRSSDRDWDIISACIVPNSCELHNLKSADNTMFKIIRRNKGDSLLHEQSRSALARHILKSKINAIRVCLWVINL